MAATISTNSANPFDFLNGSGSSTSASAAGAAPNASEQNDRFLKLLTAQLTHQDPLNPMDNSQMTSQIAQISTVSGIEQMNASMKSLATQFVQMQMLQGASMVGRDAVVAGDTLTIDGSKAGAGYELPSAADKVSVDVLDAAGNVVRSVNLGAQSAGQHDFSLAVGNLSSGAEYHFRVNASLQGNAVTATELNTSRVDAISNAGGTLTLQLANGDSVAYEKVKALH